MNKKRIFLIFLAVMMTLISAGAVSAADDSGNNTADVMVNNSSSSPPAADPIIDGIVYDENDQPVNGATITVYDIGDTEFNNVLASTTTDVYGYYTVSFINSATEFKICAHYDGYLDPVLEVPVTYNPSDGLYYGTCDFQLGVVYVDGTNGSSSYDGSSPTPQGGTVGPKSTIQDGIDTAQNGWIVRILEGTYLENVIIDHPVKVLPYQDDDVTVQADDTGQPVFTINTDGSGSTIQGLNIIDGYPGIYLDNCTDCTIQGNDISYCSGGIWLEYSSNIQLIENWITGNTWDPGIYLSFSDYNTISGNEIAYCSTGLSINYSSENYIDNSIRPNYVYYNSNGIVLSFADQNHVIGNDITDNNYDGIYFNSSSDNEITGNKIEFNGDSGLYLTGDSEVGGSSDNNRILENDISHNSMGISLDSLANNNLVNFNRIVGNSDYGISNIYNTTLDATNNWWGTNTAPTSIVGAAEFDPWITLTSDAYSYSIPTDDWTAINVSLIINSATEDTSISGYYVPFDGIISTDLGSIGGSDTYNFSGNGISSFAFDAGPTPGIANINIDVDGVLDGFEIEIIGTTIYVDGTNGDDLNDGLSLSNAKKTIQGAVDEAYNNYYGTLVNIVITQGTYTENVFINTPVYINPYDINTVLVIADDTSQPIFTINTDGSGSTIQGLNIIGSWAGIYLYYSDNNTIYENNINSNYGGIYIYFSSGNEITNNQIIYNYDGIYLESSTNNTITWNTINNNENYGISLNASPNNTLKSNILQDNVYNFSVDCGDVEDFVQNIYDPINHPANPETWNYINGNPIYYLINQEDNLLNGTTAGYIGLVNCNNITIENITITQTGQGILLASTTNSTIQNNTFQNNEYGIYLYYSNNNTISENNINNNNRGINFFNSNVNIISENNINNNEYGIDLGYSSGNHIIDNNQITDCNRAINLDYSSNNLISGNNINHNGNYWSSGSGIVTLSNSSDNQILNNYITDNTQGLQIRDNSQNNLIKGNQITQIQDYGIILHNATLNEITENYLDSNSRGIMLENSSNNTLSNNEISNSYSEDDEWWGIYGVGCFTLLNSPENTLTNNTLLNNRYSFTVLGNNTSDFIEYIDDTNTIDGQPIYYYLTNPAQDINGTDTLNYPDGIGYLGLINCSAITISNLNISNNGQGILLAGSTNIIIQNCNLSDNINGISIYNSYTQIEENNINNNHSNGMYIKNSDAVIQFNRIVDNNNGLDLINDGSILATLNWWGTNEDPSSMITNDGTISLTYDPWLILTVTANPTNIPSNGSTEITADLIHDSNDPETPGSNEHDPTSEGHVPDSIPVEFDPTLILIDTDFNTSNGKVRGRYETGSTPDTVTINATVDGVTIPVNVTIESTPSVHNITSNHDFTTIQEAIDDPTTSNGDIIEIDSGIYTENVTVYKQLTIRPSSGASVTVNTGSEYCTFLIDPSGSGSTIQGLTITGNTYNAGISLEGTENCIISGNTISNCERGIFIIWSTANTLSGNILLNNIWNLCVTGNSVSEYVQTIDTSNTINGKPVYYIIGDTSGLVIDGTQAPYFSGIGYLGLVSCTGVTVQNINITNGSGILLAYTTGSTIKDSVFISNRDGISLEHSDDNTFTGNKITNNEIGVVLWDSGSNGSPNTISRNDITSNNCGIVLESHVDTKYNNILENNITLNEYGTILDDLVNTNINFNRIVENTYAIDNYNDMSITDATLNWWGTNNNLGTEIPAQIQNSGSITITYDPWLILTIKADSTNIPPNGNTFITADLTHDSTYDPLDPSTSEHDTTSERHVPDGIPVNFLYDPTSMGTLTTTTESTSGGKASTTFTSSSSTGTVTISTIVDGVTVSTDITVEENNAPTANAIPGTNIYILPITVTITASDDTDPTPDIYYTTDGTDPITSGTRTIYTGPISIITTTTLNFAAQDETGDWSPVYTETYTGVTDIYVSPTGNDTWDGLTETHIDGTNHGPKLTLYSANMVAEDGCTIHIADGTYTGANNRNITISKNITIIGQSRAGIIFNGSDTAKIFYITSGLTVNISNLTFTNCYSGSGNAGGVIQTYGNLNITNCSFTNNRGTYAGAISNLGNLTVNDSSFINNTSSCAGAIYNGNGDGAQTYNCTITINNSIFTDNTSSGNAGAIANWGTGTTVANINNSIFTNNSALDGGAILNGGNDFTDTVNIDNCTFNQNNVHRSSGQFGTGGAVNNSRGTVTVVDSIFTGNTAEAYGGAIYTIQGQLTLNYNRFIGNSADIGGDTLYNHENPVNITIDAENNWWGSNVDPKTVPDLISGYSTPAINIVDTDPWLLGVYVDSTAGNDAWDGLSLTHIDGTNYGPKATIQGGVDAAELLYYEIPVYLFIIGGTYTENVIIDSPVVLKPYSTDVVTVQAPSVGAGIDQVIFTITQTGIGSTIEGLTITGANNTTWSYGIHTDDNSSGNIITKNILTNNSCGIDLRSSANQVIENQISGGNLGIEIIGYGSNVIDKNIINSTGTGISLAVSSDNVITGNTISNNTGSGISIQMSSSRNQIDGNTITNNAYNGITIVDNPIGTSTDNIISNNKITNNLRGIRISSGDTTPINVTIFQNIISNNTEDGIRIDRICTAEIHFNSIVGNGQYAINHTIGTATVNAQYNWWGTNYGPATVPFMISGSVASDHWLILILTADPTSIPIDTGNSIVTADLTHDSTYDPLNPSASEHDPASGHVPDGIPVDFDPELILIDTNFNTSNGKARGRYDAGSNPDIVTINATMDGTTVSTSIKVGNRPPTLDTIGDKNTNENSNLQFTVTGTDPDGDTTTITATRLPAGATFNGTTFNWTPGYGQSGTYTITFTITDGTLTDTEEITINILKSDIKAPLIINIDPANGTTSFNGDKNLMVTFSEDIIEGTNWIELVNSAREAIPFTMTITDNILTITPSSDLPESKYKLMLHTGCVTDLAGNILAGKSISFSVGNSPTITATSPENGETNIYPSKTITITFSKAIRKSSNFWVELIDSSGTAIDYTSYITGGNILVIKPTSDLVASTYRLKLHTGCVTDLAGNPLAGRSISFNVVSVFENELKIVNNGTGKIYVDYTIKITDPNGKITTKRVKGYINPGNTLNYNIGSYPSKTKISIVQYIYNKASTTKNIDVENYIYISGKQLVYQHIIRKNIPADGYVKI